MQELQKCLMQEFWKELGKEICHFFISESLESVYFTEMQK